MKLIEHIKDPERVLVIWQRPDEAAKGGAGERYLVGEVRRQEGRVYLEYYDNDDATRARAIGFNGFTTFPADKESLYNGNVDTVLSKRLASTSRPDYEQYLVSHRINPEQAEKLSVLGLLAYTGGKLASDGFSFAHTFENTTPPFDFTFEVAGFRHNDGMKHFQPIDGLLRAAVEFVPEPNNVSDKDAIAVYTAGVILGYVHKGLRTVMHRLLSNHQVTGHVTRLNGTPERPCVIVLVQVR